MLFVFIIQDGDLLRLNKTFFNHNKGFIILKSWIFDQVLMGLINWLFKSKYVCKIFFYIFYFFTLKQNMLTNVKICKSIFFTFDFFLKANRKPNRYKNIF